MSEELIAQLRGKLDKLGVKYHHSHNAESLEAMLAEAEGTEQEAAPETAAPKKAEPEEQKIKDGLVACRVTKWGHNKISTGDDAKPHFQRDDIVHVPLATAQSYELKYFAEMLDD